MGIKLKGYSRFVNFVKFLCIGLIILILLILIKSVVFKETDVDFELNIVTDEFEEDKTLNTIQVVAPRFYGTNNEDEPFTIFAKSAFEQDKYTVVLAKPTASLIKKNKEKIDIIAHNAKWHHNTRLLNLEGEVRIKHTDYQIDTEVALINMMANTAEATKGVYIHGPQGNIQSNDFFVDLPGKVLTFKGKVKTVIYQDKS